jgi:carboxylesterase type B
VADPPGCPQSIPCNLPLPELTCPKRVTEDCLYLNVFTPLSAQPDAKIPVMVFFHGGNFLRGYSGGFLYDGQYIANTSSTVVVTVNYRLGAIGFLVFGEGSDAIEGNYGFKVRLYILLIKF